MFGGHIEICRSFQILLRSAFYMNRIIFLVFIKLHDVSRPLDTWIERRKYVSIGIMYDVDSNRVLMTNVQVKESFNLIYSKISARVFM